MNNLLCIRFAYNEYNEKKHQDKNKYTEQFFCQRQIILIHFIIHVCTFFADVYIQLPI